MKREDRAPEPSFAPRTLTPLSRGGIILTAPITGNPMTQITARLPDGLVDEIDKAARQLNSSRTEFVRKAIEQYLEDLEDLRLGLESLQDSEEPVHDWEDLRRELLGQG